MTTSVALSPVAILQFFDNTGKPAVGGSLLTQSGGVNYATYSEPTGTTALPNPIPLNSRGECSTAAGASSPVFLQTGINYTFTLKDSAGNQLWSIANITSLNGQAVSFPTASGTANAQIVTNAVPISLGTGTIQWFLPVAANTTVVTLNVDNTGAKNVYYLHAPLTGAELQPNVPYEAIYDGTQWNILWTGKGPSLDYYLDTGSASSMAVSAGYATAITNGIRLKVKAAATSTSATSIFNLTNSSGASSGPLNIYVSDGTTLAPAGSIIINNIYTFTYDSSLNSSAGGWIIADSSTVNGSFTLTLTGVSSGGTGTVPYFIPPNAKSVDATVPASLQGVSNTTAMTGTGQPAAIVPATAKRLSIALQDNSAAVAGNIVIGSTAVWTFGNSTANTVMTSGNNKGFLATATQLHWDLS